MTENMPSDEEVEAVFTAMHIAVLSVDPPPTSLAVYFAMVKMFGNAAISAGFTPAEFDGAMEAFKQDFRRNYAGMTQ